MDIYISPQEVIIRLVVSVIIGGIIGFEREQSDRPAGFRTHILVILGACIVMMISATAFDPIGQGNDPTRMAAQVVTGIGFLGAGTIMRDGTNVKGLTTAASLWTCGCIGLAIGAGLYLIGIGAALVVITTLAVLGRIDTRRINDEEKILSLHVIRDLSLGITYDIESLLLKKDLSIKETKLRKNNLIVEGKSLAELDLLVLAPKQYLNLNEIIKEIVNLPGVIEVKIIK